MTEKEETKTHIIIDNGTGYCKAGLSGEEGPRAVFPAQELFSQLVLVIQNMALV